MRLVVVADDLTGAIDTAAPFAARGLATTVVTDPARLQGALTDGAQVISVTTRSREVSADEAARRVAETVAVLPRNVRLFKKIDSRMKGNLEAELSVLSFEGLLVVPAIPEFGRIVRDGMVQGFGVETPISVAAALGRFADRASVPDTVSIVDMGRALAMAGDRLLVGARGATEALAQQMSGVSDPYPVSLSGTPLTMVIGSRDPITFAQLDLLRNAYPDLNYVLAPNGRATMRQANDSATLTLLQAVPGETEATAEEVGAALADTLSGGNADRGGIFLLTGGATAEQVLDRMGIGRMALLGEFLPGLPVSRAGETLILTKSGGFGAPDTLKCVADCVLVRERG